MKFVLISHVGEDDVSLGQTIGTGGLLGVGSPIFP